MSKGICFVISQIGSNESLERKQADSLLAVIEDCCELHDLECVRADRIKKSSDINEDIIECIRSADLCIIDLTNLNPNVMYEFGIRFQTGRPYIVLAHNKTKLPFDTITKRTIFYDDLEQAAECRRVQKEVRAYLSNFESNSFRTQEIEPTLTNIYSLLQTVAQKVDALGSYSTRSVVSNSDFVSTVGLDDLLSKLDPSEAFHYAYKTNQFSLAEELLKMLKDNNHPDKFYYNKLCALANKGSAYAATELESMIEAIIETERFESILEAVGCLVSNYNRRDIEESKIDRMESVFKLASEKADSNRERASILNQKQRLWAGAKKFNEAKEIAEQVIMLNDEEPGYFYNYATILIHLDDIKGAIEQIRRMLRVVKDKDEDHLMLACQLLKESDEPNDANLYKTCLEELQKINPYKARLMHYQ